MRFDDFECERSEVQPVIPYCLGEQSMRESTSEVWGRVGEMLAAAEGDPGRAAKALLDQLSETELISMLAGSRSMVQEIVAGVSGKYNAVPYPAAAIDRLGFPGIRFADGPRGIVVGRATAFPIPMARGATFNPELERCIGDAIGAEGTALGANLFGGICINLLRHPAWGRAQESYGEDTFLLGEMGVALTESVGRHLATCVKHFALNSMENSRYIVDVSVADADLHDIYLPHFKRCIDAGVDSVMSSYNKVNGQWAGHSRQLLTDILKRQWGFEGFVMTDFGLGVRNMVDALHGGQDLEMPTTFRARKIPKALAKGQLHIDQVRESARRTTTSVFRAAARTNCAESPMSVVGCEEHRDLARKAAVSSFVLLRNESVGGTPALPLVASLDTRKPLRVALIGRLANEENTGDHGSSRVRSQRIVTVCEGMRSAASSASVALTECLNDDASEAALAAMDADAAIVVVGTTWRDEGEYVGAYGGDRKQLRLSKKHERIIEEVAAVCPRTIVVLVGGSAFITESWRYQVGAILMTWYSGDEGGTAIGQVVMGSEAPGGRLPNTWPASEKQLPEYRRWTRAITYGPLHGYRLFHATNRRPAFWFGEGMSYTTFDWGTPTLHPADVDATADGGDTSGSRASVSALVSNTGDRAGVDVVQLYLNVALGTHLTPLPTLAGFARIGLDAGSSDQVTIELDSDLYERARQQRSDGIKGAGRVWIGPSANPERLIDCGAI